MTGDLLIQIGNENVQIGLVPAQGKKEVDGGGRCCAAVSAVAFCCPCKWSYAVMEMNGGSGCTVRTRPAGGGWWRRCHDAVPRLHVRSYMRASKEVLVLLDGGWKCCSRYVGCYGCDARDETRLARGPWSVARLVRHQLSGASHCYFSSCGCVVVVLLLVRPCQALDGWLVGLDG